MPKSCATPTNDALYDRKSTKQICFLKTVSYTITKCGQEVTVPAHSSEIKVAGIDGNRSIRVWDAILAVNSGCLQHQCTSFAIVGSEFSSLLIWLPASMLEYTFDTEQAGKAKSPYLTDADNDSKSPRTLRTCRPSCFPCQSMADRLTLLPGYPLGLDLTCPWPHKVSVPLHQMRGCKGSRQR